MKPGDANRDNLFANEHLPVPLVCSEQPLAHVMDIRHAVHYQPSGVPPISLEPFRKDCYLARAAERETNLASMAFEGK